MKRIRVRLEVSQEHDNVSFPLDEVFNGTEEEWMALSDEEKEVLIDQTVDEMPDQPYWVIDNWHEE
jgi:hypothetical protein